MSAEPYVPQVGHRVRASFEGVVQFCVNGRPTLELPGLGWTYTVPPNATYERLPDPEPEWEVGAIVLDADGDIYRRVADVAYPWVDNTEPYTDRDIVRPLIRLVPEADA